MFGLPDAILLANLASTLFMVGVIWFVQVVHYPLFARVGEPGFIAYEGDHSRLTGYVVGPPMLLEAGTSVVLLLFRPEGVAGWLLWTGFALVVVIWVSTVLLQIPRHRALGAGFDQTAHRFLVASNWVRTAAWTARGVIVLWAVA
ncbi:hypothetical protein [Rubrobacter indicoceani]|uniref:hypothetical protein n=1 Tax=Rubrobacter indicoceani TaxID=2051957 RepID=UPI000E5B0261|nr:hypothetical protein [Rubrobacter indicoceani]